MHWITWQIVHNAVSKCTHGCQIFYFRIQDNPFWRDSTNHLAVIHESTTSLIVQSPPLDKILTQCNQIHAIPVHVFEVIFKILLLSLFWSSKCHLQDFFFLPHNSAGISVFTVHFRIFQVDFSGTVKYGTFICHGIHFRRNRVGQHTKNQQYTVQHVSKSQWNNKNYNCLTPSCHTVFRIVTCFFYVDNWYWSSLNHAWKKQRCVRSHS